MSRERGQSLLEFAITLPLLLLLAVGTIEFGRAFYQYNTLSKAVREAARYMASKPYNSTERTNAARIAVYGNVTGTGTPILPGLTTSKIVVTPRAGGTSETDPPHWVKVAVTNYTFQSMVPRWFQSASPLRPEWRCVMWVSMPITKPRARPRGPGTEQEKGQTLVEFAFVVILFLTVLFAIVEFGRALWTWNTIVQATRAGARFAVVETPTSTNSEVKNFVVYYNSAGTGYAGLTRSHHLERHCQLLQD